MSKVAIVGDPSGTGTFTISAPNGNTDRTLVLPDEAGTIITTAGVPASAIVNNSITSAKLTGDAIPLGVGQTWQDVLGSRSQGVTYTNTTGKPITVSIGYYVNGNPAAVGKIVINGSVTLWFCQINNAYIDTAFATVIVPNGATYQFTTTFGTMNFNSWAELR